MSKSRTLKFTPDEGVPQHRPAKSAGKTRDPLIEEYLGILKRAKVGVSFFFEGLQPADLEFLRRPCQTLGIGLAIRRVECDEIYQSAGVRVWREYGSYDDL